MHECQVHNTAPITRAVSWLEVTTSSLLGGSMMNETSLPANKGTQIIGTRLICAGVASTKLCARCGPHRSRLAFRPPECFGTNATKTRARPRDSLCRPRAPQRLGVRVRVRDWVWGRVGLGRRARLKLTTHVLQKVLRRSLLRLAGVNTRTGGTAASNRCNTYQVFNRLHMHSQQQNK